MIHKILQTDVFNVSLLSSFEILAPLRFGLKFPQDFNEAFNRGLHFLLYLSTNKWSNMSY